MRLGFVAAMLRRELRHLGVGFPLIVASIALGVAALVAVTSYANDLERAIRDQSRTLLGADVALRSGQPFRDSVTALLDSARAAGVAVVEGVDFASMAFATRTTGARLVRVRALDAAYPLYGEIATDPPGLWPSAARRRAVVVDPALLVQLDARVGDTLALGRGRFVIAGTVTKAAGDMGAGLAIAPQVVIGRHHLAETGLLTFGSLAAYAAYLGFAEPGGASAFLEGRRSLLRAQRVSARSAADIERELTGAVGRASRFLGLMALVALFFGGLGVASAVHLLVHRKVPTTATLRCLGATRGEMFLLYLTLAAVVAVAGAVGGAAAGVGLQFSVPAIVARFVPFDLAPRLWWSAIATGVGIGAWLAIVAALLPLLRVRRVSPLRALRDDADRAATSLRNRSALPAVGALGGTFFALAVLILQDAPRAGAFTAGLAGVTLALWLAARGLVALARRAARHVGPFTWRQGVANLHRPGNQTLAVVLALGFGVLLVTTVYSVQRSLLRELAVDAEPDRPNLVFFDVQRDQEAGVHAILREAGHPPRFAVPIVPTRLVSVDGRSVAQILADSGPSRTPRWVLRREYRVTYQDSLGPRETVVAGRTWRGPVLPGQVPEISLDREIADELGVGLGSRLGFDVQGVVVEARVTSLRDVGFTRLEPNFFVIFQSGVLEGAPGMRVTLTRVPGDARRGELQRLVAERYPNVVGVDLTLLQRAIDDVLGRVMTGVRFLSFVSIGTGLLVLVGAVATSKLQRVNEAALLKTLGATSRQVRAILLAEYAALGLVGATGGTLLGGGVAWLLSERFLAVPFAPDVAALAAGALTLGVVTATLGWVGSRDVFRRTPLAALRAE